ncbi:MAG: metallophosphoesterase [Pirellulales bacterium]
MRSSPAKAGTTNLKSSVIVNAAVEDKQHGGPTNDDSASAEDIGASFIPLGFDATERAVMLGSLTEGDPADWYRFTLEDGQSATVAATVLSAGKVTVDLYDASAQWLATVVRAANADAVISNFVDMTNDGLPAFGSVVNLGAGVNTDLNELDPALSADGLTLLLSSNRADTFGGHDLYMATRTATDEPFGNVVNLGSGVNSLGNDRAPALSADALRLLFHSDRSVSFGRNDIFQATRSSALASFNQSVNLGMSINTARHERNPEFAFDGTTILLESIRTGGQGKFDLYQAAAGPADFFRFTLTDGQSATVGLKMLNGSGQASSDVPLELTDGEGNLLAQGEGGAENLDWVIRNFVDPTSDGVPETYFVRIAAHDTDYSLVVTRDAVFDTEDNDGPGPLAQDISATGTALGSVTGVAGVGQSLSFAVIGDYGDGDQGEAAVANMIKNWNPDFIITTGDNNYNSGSAGTIDPHIGQFYSEFIGAYRGNYDTAGNNIGPSAADPGRPNRFFPSLGNHDWQNPSPGPNPYVDYFTLPGDGFTSSSGNERYYDFVWGDVRFFAYDADSAEPDGRGAGSAQAN